jgi:hypothetical protein
MRNFTVYTCHQMLLAYSNEAGLDGHDWLTLACGRGDAMIDIFFGKFGWGRGKRQLGIPNHK